MPVRMPAIPAVVATVAAVTVIIRTGGIGLVIHDGATAVAIGIRIGVADRRAACRYKQPKSGNQQLSPGFDLYA